MKSIRRSTLIVAVLSILPSSVALAGVNSWTTHGPEGGEISALAIEPGSPLVVFAGTSKAGVFKSTDGATSWQPASNGLPASILSLVFDSTTPPNLYAVTDSGVFLTNDRGGHWTAMPIPGTGSIQSLVIDPHNPKSLYARTNHLCVDITTCSSGGVFRSTDGGTTWLSSNNGLPEDTFGGYALSLLTIDTVTPTTLYCSPSFRLHKSLDGGANWTELTSATALETGFRLMATDPGNPSWLYLAGSGFADFFGQKHGGGVFKSFDSGAHWSYVSGNLPYGSYKNVNSQAASLLVVDPTSSEAYVGGTAGLWKISDTGHAWSSTGLNQSINTLTIDPTNPSTLYAGDSEGVRKSFDAGATWIAQNTGIGNTTATILTVAVDSQNSGTIYAGTSNHLFRSVDGGGSWIETAFAGGASSLACDPFRSGMAYAVSAGKVIVTWDAGATWQYLPDSLLSLLGASYLAIDPLNSGTLYAVGGAGRHLFKTASGGSSWDEIAVGFFADKLVSSITVDSTNPGTVYLGSNSGIWKSVDGGANWSLLTGSPACIDLACPIASDAQDANTFYGAGGYPDYGVFKSADGGFTWGKVSSGLPASAVNALVIDPVAHTTLMVGTPDGVFRSVDGGATWFALDAGLANRNVTTLAIDATGTNLHAGTAGGGVFDYQIVPLGPCSRDAATLCLSNGRFSVQADWQVPSRNTSGHGMAVPLSGDTGYFWFFNPDNVEMIVKVLAGCGINAHEWVFAGGLTDVEVTLTVTDTETGEVKTYVNPAGTPFQPVQDTTAFESCPASLTASFAATYGIPGNAASSAPRRPAEPFASSMLSATSVSCTADPTTLCLSGSRFKVQAGWRSPSQGTSGQGAAVSLTSDTGYFWFFDSSNVEMIVKVLDGCSLNSKKWVFAGGLTNVEVTLTVTDTQTGDIRTYVNPAGTAFQPVQDTAAFGTCP